MDMQNRFQAALLGVLTGDSLLAEWETWKSPQIQNALRRRGGLVPTSYIEPFKRKRLIEPGHPTDDSELTAALALALIETGILDSPSCPKFEGHVYARCREFIHGAPGGERKSFLTNGKAYGSGGTLRSALRAYNYHDSFEAFRRGQVKVLPTNGSLMRCMPIALRYVNNIPKAVEMAQRQSCVTHVHPDAQVACMTYSMLGCLLLRGEDRFTAWQETKKVLERIAQSDDSPDKMFAESYAAVLRINTRMPTEAELWPNTGEVVISLRIAISALLNATTFGEGIEMVAVVGGDVDTYGAIAGGLLGAHFGLEVIPQVWQNVLIGRDKMVELADKLYTLATA